MNSERLFFFFMHFIHFLSFQSEAQILLDYTSLSLSAIDFCESQKNIK